MSDSKLVTYKRITENKSNRANKIDTITIHCLVAQWTAKQGCDYFATTDRQCSVNYVVGSDGSIGLSVPEAYRSWCTSSRDNDNRAVTIEVASDMQHPYAVTDLAYEALIKLVADICKRNGIEKLKWSTNKDERVNHKNGCNMTVHRDYENKSCPGKYLYDKHGDIAKRVNAILSGKTVIDDEITQAKVSTSKEVKTVKIELNVLKTGSTGAQVKNLQRILKQRGWKDAAGNVLAIDGDFGSKTAAAVKKFQKNMGITADGVVGEKTWGKLLKS